MTGRGAVGCPLNTFIKSGSAKNPANTKNKRDIIINYQYALREIPLWNQSFINTEVDKIRGKCEFLDDLVAAIFVTNVKALSLVHATGNARHHWLR